MKIKYIFWGIISISIFFTACGSILQGNSSIVVEEERDNRETKVTMTEEQKELLINISVNEERVRRGELLEWQKEVLRQYDYVMEYLKKKYPSYTFHIVDCEPKNKLNQAYSTFNFTEGSDKEGYFDLYLEVEDGKYSAKDNFYGHIIEPKCEEKLMELLKQENIPCNKVEANISNTEGEAFNEKLNVEDIINRNIIIEQMITFYIDSNDLKGVSYEELFNQIHECMDQKKINAYYIVSIYDSINDNKEVFNDDFDEFN